MKIAATEAQWDTCSHCPFSLFQIGGFTQSDQTPSFSIEIPDMLSFLATGSFSGKVQGLDQAERAVRGDSTGRATTCRRSSSIYWSMRVMAYAGSFVALVAAGRRVPLLEAAARSGEVVPVDRRS